MKHQAGNFEPRIFNSLPHALCPMPHASDPDTRHLTPDTYLVLKPETGNLIMLDNLFCGI